MISKFEQKWFFKEKRSCTNIPELNEKFERIAKTLDSAEVKKLMGEIYKYAYDNHLMVTIAAIDDIIATGKAGFDLAGGFASNGYGEHSPGGYSLMAALVTEVVMTFIFVMIIMGATDKRAPQGFAPIAIGLGLTLIHLISIPVTNTSVNPARSTGVAVFAGGWAVSQLWLFWIAPIAGAILAGVFYRWLGNE